VGSNFRELGSVIETPTLGVISFSLPEVKFLSEKSYHIKVAWWQK